MIICINGPTGVGKTKLSIELAKKYNAIIVNGDAMQVYKKLDIGTAKVREDEKEGIPHFLFDIVDVNDVYTVYDYQRDLRKFLSKNANKNIIIVGGSGLYVKAGLYDYRFNDVALKNEYKDISNEELYDMVKKIDAKTEIHVNNRKRLVSFLNNPNTEIHKDDLLYDVIFIGLTTERNTLYDVVDRRVDKMVNDGLIDEVKSLYDENIRSKAVMTGIGYKELYDYFDGKVSLEEAISNIKKNTRHFIKRQYTWYNNQMNIKWFNTDFADFSKTVNEVINFIDGRIRDKQIH